MSPEIRMMSMTLFIQIITFFLFTGTVSSSPSKGFTMDLFQRRTNSSSSRISTTKHGSSPYADTVFDSFEYLMKLQIGTPPVEIEAILDTGSSLIWTDCLPCRNCLKQSGPVFNPSKSSTYKERICNNDTSCSYEIFYGDGSYSRGTLATETVMIQSTSGKSYVMPKTTIGCSHNSSVMFRTSASGIVGLNRATSSLVSQMGEGMLGLMSYCFSGEGTSKLNFGSNAIVSGDGTVAANMFFKEDPNMYYLNLDAVSVGKTRIDTLGTPFHAVNGNMIIATATTYTFFPESYCNKVRKAVENVVKADREASPNNKLCYKTNNMDMFPVITMHFQGGADLLLDKYNTYETFGEVTCLMILCDPGTAVFGNRAQNNLNPPSVLYCGSRQDKPRESFH